MKNLMTYTPEPFENLEIMDAEYDALTGEGDMEDGFVPSRRTRGIRRPGAKRAGRVPMLSKRMKPVKPFLPRVPLRPLMPVVPVPFPYVPMGSNALIPANNAAADKSRSSAGQSAGSEGSFANAPAQDVSSEHVRWVQETLNRALGLRLMVDGIMNRETRSAVRMFQERKGLPVTGLVGPDTEEALRAEGGQAAAEPELLEGEWEMPDSGECSCGGREMEEFVFETEPFGGAEFGELESESTPPVAAPRVLTYTTKDVIDKRISVPAQHSLVRLSKNPATNADAAGLLQAVKSGQLAGIYCVNWEIAAKRAQRLGKTWWTVIQQGEDSVLLLDPDKLKNGIPLIAFRRELDPRKEGCGVLKNDRTSTPSPSRIDAALMIAWKSYQKIQDKQFKSCNEKSYLAVKNVVPTVCRIYNGKSATLRVRSWSIFPATTQVHSKSISLAPQSIAPRPCCMFASREIIDPSLIGSHRNATEKNGIIYTGKAGFIDLGHIRDHCDITELIFRQLLNGQNRIEIITTGLGYVKRLGVYVPEESTQLVGVAELVGLNLNMNTCTMIRLARSIARDHGIGHEIVSYWINRPGMHNSSFSPEDLCSNFLGTLVAERALVDRVSSTDCVINMNGNFKDRATYELNNLLNELNAQTDHETHIAFNMINKRWIDGYWLSNGYLKRRNFEQIAWKTGHSSDSLTPKYLLDQFSDQRDRYIYTHTESGSAILSSDYTTQISRIRSDACATARYGSMCDKP